MIDRFSEDIDLIIDRKLLGFEELNSNSQVKKLRKKSGNFIVNEFREELIHQLTILGISSSLYEIKFNDTIDDTSDPTTLEIHYKSVLNTNYNYIQKRVLLELGARSLTEPSENKTISSFIDSHFKQLPFAQVAFEVQVVKPIRTFIEKVLLLHEEFSKPSDKIRTDRLTRHFYDLEKMMDTSHGIEAIQEQELFKTIVEHRKKVTPIRGMDYSNHKKGKLRITPPKEVFKNWGNDYKEMQQFMMTGESLTWNALIERIKEIERRFNS